MHAEIHRHWMITPAREDGRRAAAYDVLVPLEECPEDAKGIITRIQRATGLYFRSFENATWTTGLPPGIERYCRWLDHEKACEAQMLEWLHEHCPETAGVDKWPMFWCYVEPDASMEIVVLEVQDAEIDRIRRAAEQRRKLRIADRRSRKQLAQTPHTTAPTTNTDERGEPRWPEDASPPQPRPAPESGTRTAAEHRHTTIPTA